MYQTATIKLLDFNKPIRQRDSKHTSPYYFTPSANITQTAGVGGYMRNNELAKGSFVRLRIELANDHLTDYGYSSLSRIDGYYIDEDQDQTLVPMVARLPSSRGFLAGWTMGENMSTYFAPEIYDDIEDAARAAHAEAEYDADRAHESEREFQAAKKAFRLDIMYYLPDEVLQELTREIAEEQTA